MSIAKWIIVIFVILLFGVSVVAGVQNIVALKMPVTLVFFSYQSQEMPLFVVALITFAVGVISMGIYGMVVFLRLKKQIRRLMIEAKANKKELNSLRNLSVTSEDDSLRDLPVTTEIESAKEISNT